MYPSADGGFVTVQKYVTERKRAETELRRSEAYLAEAQKLSHCASWAWNAMSGAMFWSLEHFRIFGVDPGVQPSYPSLLNWVHEEDRSAVQRRFDDAVRTGGDYDTEFRIARPDGTTRHIRSVARPVRDDSGRLAEYVGMIMDVTEAKAEEKQREDVLRRLSTAQEDERRRIARELHDRFGQLSAIGVTLRAIAASCRDQTALAGQLESVADVVRELDEEADSIIWQLRPPALDDHGLEAALHSHIARWTMQFKVPVDLYAANITARHETHEVATTLFRVAQEALNNISKHSGATRVAMLLEGRADHVSLLIEDDGIGFDVATAFDHPQKRLGLLGMRERLSLIGGTLGIESILGKGTTIVARVPT
jgi:signal transduction histidine kinase